MSNNLVDTLKEVAISLGFRIEWCRPKVRL
jgi:hypothetical protein